ncbi:DUF1120 domain-containing protein [Pseudomonas fluorescens]|uniref:DUF1120 domain-containing protein n=1 Tax=Pseudomonas TaxID=286 RepID=UPI001903F86C|nr:MULTISPECIES: DUF1120 domain-containing protein [Pseudomonas]MBD8090245.1 DUF1120 domain-containing protein [Pseudomonas fluorescens]MBD8716483.1 DUF1120 domain-containing protein [Pseudomonas fluorescens]MDL2187906.1 DUF1120 domain-containing protein [Pseudomonas sp. ChxA]
MARSLTTLAAALMLTGAGPVWAASDTDLSVSGIITPASCTPTLSDGGVVDHGKLTARDLNPDKPTSLQVGEMSLQVQCEGPTFFTLSTVDSRAGSAALNPAHHGLGMVNDDQKLGNVAFGLFDPLADNVPAQAILSRDGGATWSPSAYLGHSALTSFAPPSGPYAPMALQTLSARLRAFTTIVPASDLTLLDEVPIDGLAVMQLKYW